MCSGDSFPEKKTKISFPESLKEGENIWRHLQQDVQIMANHFSGNILEIPTCFLGLGMAELLLCRHRYLLFIQKR